MPASAQSRWSSEEDARLKHLAESNASTGDIAAELKRTKNAVLGRAYALGISLKRIKKRPRLGTNPKASPSARLKAARETASAAKSE